jgi:hypothetical protein
MERLTDCICRSANDVLDCLLPYLPHFPAEILRLYSFSNSLRVNPLVCSSNTGGTYDCILAGGQTGRMQALSSASRKVCCCYSDLSILHVAGRHILGCFDLGSYTRAYMCALNMLSTANVKRRVVHSTWPIQCLRCYKVYRLKLLVVLDSPIWQLLLVSYLSLMQLYYRSIPFSVDFYRHRRNSS